MKGAASTPDPWKPMHFLALRKARCETQAELAEAAQVAEHSVWMWESGRRTPTRPSTVRRLNDLLESLTPAQRERYDHELARLQKLTPAERAQRRVEPVGDDTPRCAHCGANTPNGYGGNVNRRDMFEALAVGAAVGLTGAVPLGRRQTPRVNAAFVAGREQIMTAFAGCYLTDDAHDLLPAVTAYADGLAPVLDAVPTHDLGLRLAAVTVDAHAMAGALAYLVGDRPATLHHLLMACHYADDARDPLLRARAWALRAKYVYSPLPNGYGNARQAVAELGRARALALHADGHTRAWVGASLAEEAADLGDVGLCEWAIEDAARALDTGTDEARGFFFSPQSWYACTPAYVQGVYGRVAGLAGRVDEAERAISQEIAGALTAGHRIHALRHLGTVRIENEEPEGACAALSDGVEYALMTGNTAQVPRIRAVRQRMDPVWEDLDCVRDLDERLRAVA
jgi:hypothetical protein